MLKVRERRKREKPACRIKGVLHLLSIFWRSTYIIRNKNGCQKTKPRAEASWALHSFPHTLDRATRSGCWKVILETNNQVLNHTATSFFLFLLCNCCPRTCNVVLIFQRR
jgi:hypothetical protein